MTSPAQSHFRTLRLPSPFQARLNAAITSGRMTQDQAGSVVQFFKTRLTDLLNGVTPTGPGGFGGPGATPEATPAATAAS